MAKLVNLKIDGKDVQVAEGTNLIDAAETAGIHIPNLCYMKGMKGIGACRLCLVEIEGSKAPIIACTTKVKEGMNIPRTRKGPGGQKICHRPHPLDASPGLHDLHKGRRMQPSAVCL